MEFDKQKRKSMKLTKRLVFFSILPITIVLLIGAVISVGSVVTTTDKFLEHEVIYYANLESERLNGYFEKYYMLVEEASHNPALESYFRTLTDSRDYNSNPYYGEVSEILDSIIDSSVDEENRALLWLADIDAQMVMEDSESGMMKTLEEDNWRCENRSWYEEALESYDTFYAKVYVSAGAGEAVSSMIAPIRDSDTGELLGVLGVDIEVDKLPEIMGKEEDDNSFLLIINRDGLILYHEDTNQILDKCQNLDYYESIETQLWSNHQSTCRFDVEGEKMIGAITRIDRAGWMMISAIPVKNLHESILTSVLPILFICVLNIIAVVTLNYYFTKEYIINPLKEIEKATENIAHQNPDYELVVKNQDEIGSIANVLNTDVKWLFKELKDKNQRIHEGMEYAKLFQTRMFSQKEDLDEIFAEYAVMYTPLESVGGDFTWCFRGPEGNLWIIGDCTGHGVSGALLSGMAIVMLSNIVTESNCSNLEEILRELDSQFDRLMQSDSNEREVGIVSEMDIGMLYISNSQTMRFFGGNIDLYMTDGGDVQKIKGQKLHIGSGSLKETEEISIHNIDYNQKYTYFIATDGFYEQTGGRKGIPYGYSRFKKVFGSVHGKPTKEMMLKIKRKWLEYKGANRQRDDVTAFCCRVR